MLATNVRFGGNIRRTGALALAALALVGCADLARVASLRPQPVDPASPVAAQVTAASRLNTRTPRFRDVPPPPAGVRPPADFKGAVADSTRAGDQLAAWVAANPSMLPQDPAQTEAFAAGQRATIPAGQVGVVPPPAGSEDYAAGLRAYAAPPPPPN